MDFIQQTFFILFTSLLSYLVGNKTFKKQNLKVQIKEFFYPIKNDYDLFLIGKNYFKDDDILLTMLTDLNDKYEKLTPYFTNKELTLYRKMNLLLIDGNVDLNEILNLYLPLINLIKVRYNKVTKLYFFPKWEN